MGHLIMTGVIFMAMPPSLRVAIALLYVVGWTIRNTRDRK
jgi:hypothetical protein